MTFIILFAEVHLATLSISIAINCSSNSHQPCRLISMEFANSVESSMVGCRDPPDKLTTMVVAINDRWQIDNYRSLCRFSSKFVGTVFFCWCWKSWRMSLVQLHAHMCAWSSRLKVILILATSTEKWNLFWRYESWVGGINLRLWFFWVQFQSFGLG